MEIELQHLQGRGGVGEEPFHTDICVLGGGIAGLTVAHRLVGLGCDVLLVEAGGKQPAGLAPDNNDHALGGNSLHWGGQLMPPATLSGWPVSAQDLAPYWADVEHLLGVDALPYEAASFYKTVNDTSLDTPLGGGEFTARMSKFAPFHRRNLAASLGQELLRHGGVRVLLRTVVVGVRLGPQANRVASVEVRGLSGRVHAIHAKRVVLATGTEESCRLLREMKLSHPKESEHIVVGSGFHDHLTLELATFGGRARERVLALAQPWLVGGLRGTVHSLKLELADRLRLEMGLPWAMAHFTFEEPQESGLAKVRTRLKDRQQGAGMSLKDAGTVARSSAELLRSFVAASRNRRRFLSPRARVSLRLNVARSLPPGNCAGEVAVQSSLRPAPWTWEPTGEQAATLRRTADRVRQYLERQGLHADQGATWAPTLSSDGPLQGLEDARHAMGGAYMGMDPQNSVVDAQLRVHGIANLWVASAAVLPDGRAQLPTMTLMALCLRLADRLRAEPAV